MSVRQRYLEAVDAVRPRAGEGRTLTPSVLATAAVAVLPVAAAGISLSQGGLRVPLGWSRADAAIAERQQTTLGDGPCLTAAASGQVVVADGTDIARRWPGYYAEIESRTRFRSVAALPLQVAGQSVRAALNLYAEQADLVAVLRLDDAETVALAAAELLFGLLDEGYEGEEGSLPDWVDARSALDRVSVWTAVGMMISATELDDADALALLRAYSYGNDLSLDETAARLVDRRLTLQAVLA